MLRGVSLSTAPQLPLWAFALLTMYVQFKDKGIDYAKQAVAADEEGAYDKVSETTWITLLLIGLLEGREEVVS